MSMTTDRRSFLFGASVAGFGILAPGRRGWAGGVGPNETLNIACIGVGGKGSSDTDQAAHHGRIVAICDIDQKRLDAKGEKHKEAKKYNDFRELLHELGPRLDAVVVSTPDHTHAIAAVTAMRMGKHVYCQKPLAHSVYEARLMRETARQQKVCTQMGNQGTAKPGFRRGAEIVRGGHLGPVREVHVWTNRPFKYWKQAPDIVARPADGTGPAARALGPVPRHRPRAALQPRLSSPRLARLVGLRHRLAGRHGLPHGQPGVHGARSSACRRGSPPRAAPINPETYPAWATITYEFPGRGSLPPVKLTWYEGAKDGKRNLPPDDLFPKGFKPSDSGSLFIGTRGQMYSPSDYGAEQMLWPEEAFKDLKDPERIFPRIEGGRGEDDNQKREWVAAIRAGKPAGGAVELRLRRHADRGHAAGQRRRPLGRVVPLRPRLRPDHRQPHGRRLPQALLPQGMGALSTSG